MGNPYANDKLNRRSYGTYLKRILKECSALPHCTGNESYVVAISAKWGFGKSTFLKMFQESLKGDPEAEDIYERERLYEDGNILFYNAWENDFWNTAFVPFYDLTVSSLLRKFTDNTGDLKKAKEMLASGGRVLGSIFTGLAKTQIDKIIGSGTTENIAKEMASVADMSVKKIDAVKDMFPEYASFRKAIVDVKEGLGAFIKIHGPVIIMIDELDRCRPDFAVQTLEIVKHIFDVKGLTFVFALDLSQLQHCVKVVYGNEFDAIGYLERFFDYTSLLPDGTQEALLGHFLADYGMNELTAIAGQMSRICANFGLSAREIRTVISSYRVFYSFELKDTCKSKNAWLLYFYLLVLKYKEPVKFVDACQPAAFALRKDLLDKYAMVFAEVLEEKIANVFKDALTNATAWMIKDIPFFLIGDDKLTLGKEARIGAFQSLGDKESLSLALYAPDLVSAKLAENKTLMGYYYNRLEFYGNTVANIGNDH